LEAWKNLGFPLTEQFADIEAEVARLGMEVSPPWKHVSPLERNKYLSMRKFLSTVPHRTSDFDRQGHGPEKAPLFCFFSIAVGYADFSGIAPGDEDEIDKD
jgi:hypothetical protein